MKLLSKILIMGAFSSLGGCVIAPVGPPGGAYYGARIVAPAPYIAISPYYYGYGPRFYYGRRW
jgi:hypothetical protein